jgi:HEAT repeat protein
MPTAEMLAAQLARCVERFRNADAKSEQKAEFRALLALLETNAMTVRHSGGQVTVNGSPVDGVALTSLVQRLALHHVAEITVPQTPLPAEVFELVRALAAQPGTDDGPAMPQPGGTGRVSVTIGSPGTPTVPAPVDLGTEGILRGDPMTDIASAGTQVAGVGQITHDPQPPAPETALPTTGKRPTGRALPHAVDGPATVPPPPRHTPPPAAPPPQPASPPAAAAPPVVPPAPAPPAAAPGEGPSAVFAPAVARAQTPAALLQELDSDPERPNLVDVLSALGRQAEHALQENRVEQVLEITVALVRLEQRASDNARRSYGIALRRLFSKPLLRAIADLLLVPKTAADALTALRRGGTEAADVLLQKLVLGQAINERRAVFDTLCQLSVTAGQVIPLLRHEKWYVIRNSAELIGEKGLAEAVPELAECLDHDDERVRKTAALALAKIGTASTGEPLRRALRDKSPEVRIQVALGVGARRTSGFAMPLVVALQEEEDEAVQRELILALGRIGTPDAVQALIKIAQPAGRLFGRKPTGLRLAAVEGLRLAGTAPALGTLEGLGDDGDKQVRAAAQAATKELLAKKR